MTRGHFSSHSDDCRSECIIITLSSGINVQQINSPWVNLDFTFSMLYTNSLQNLTVRMLPKKKVKLLYIIIKLKYFCLLCFVFGTELCWCDLCGNKSIAWRERKWHCIAFNGLVRLSSFTCMPNMLLFENL